MPRASRILAASAVGSGLLLLCASAICEAQAVVPGPDRQAAAGAASFAPGSIGGVVLDDLGKPIAGAMVSTLGPTPAFALTDQSGRFELRTLAPGPYVLRARVAGYAAPRPQLVDVRAGARTPSSISLRRPGDLPVVLAADFGALVPGDERTSTTNEDPDPAASGDPSPVNDDESETAWRIRHLRRGVLKDAAIPDDVLADAGPPAGSGWFAPADFLGRAAGSSARLATGFFATTPFSGQVNLLTSGSLDATQDLFSPSGLSRNIANVSVSAPAGDGADWTARGAFTQGDFSSWIVAGSYRTRAPATHSYDVGLSYATERYADGSPLALRDMSDGSRSAGDVYGFDTVAVQPALSVTYGARYARYDYLERPDLISPKVAVGWTPASHLRLNAMLAHRGMAPGAQEFLPPEQAGLWLPPQRTFSSLTGGPLMAEHVTHTALAAERDFGRSTVAFEVFHQQIGNQLITMFDVGLPGVSSTPGHYFVGSAGDGSAAGYAASLRAELSQWVRGSIEYSVAEAEIVPGSQMQYLVLVAPSVLRSGPERIHNVSTTIETNVPETSTRVLVLCRMSNASGRPGTDSPTGFQRFDSRFDVQLRQSLPFMDFTSTKWEMLVDVRNFFLEADPDQSVYDELFVVHPPTRIVGGLTMHF